MRLIKIAVGLTVLFLVLPSAAEEIVYFKTGQSMPIRSHEVIDGMLTVDLGDNNVMAFPEFTIDRIEIAGKTVSLKPSYGHGANRRVPSPQGSYPVQGRRPVEREAISQDHSKATPVETDPRTGLAFYRPQGHREAPNRSRMAVTGNMRIFGNNPTRQGAGDTYTGTTQLGNRHVIGGIEPRRNQNARNPNMPKMVPLEMKDMNAGSTAQPPSSGDTGTPPPAGSDNR